MKIKLLKYITNLIVLNMSIIWEKEFKFKNLFLY
jgi:hypothetical protein